MSLKLVDLKKQWPWGDEFLRSMRKRLGPKAIVAFSSGKDAVAMAIAMKPYFEELIPFCCYYVPGLKIMDEALAYYEDKIFDGKPIIRAPHPVFIDWISSLRYQTPESARELLKYDWPSNVTMETYARDLAEKHGLPEDALYSTGARAGEFFTRSVMVQRTGGVQASRRQWWPIWHMNRAEVLDTIEKAGVALSREYDLFHSSFCGLDYGFMSQLKKHEPEDWETIKRWFPLIDAELWRFERQKAA